MNRYRDQLPNVKTFLPLDGTINYEAGKFRRPLSCVAEYGLEYFYRLVEKPKQRWRRYRFHKLPALFCVVMQRLGFYKNPFEAK